MSSETMRVARDGFAAWRRGDFEAIEAILDPGVEWRWFEPGEWDCHGRAEVMGVVRERYEQGFATGELEFVDGGPDAIVVVAHPADVGGEGWPRETATVLTFRDRAVIRMQDHRTRADALASCGRPPS